MTVALSRATLLGAAVVATIAVAVPVAVARHGSAATIRVAPLSAQDHRVLAASRPLIEALPKAFAEVPLAASDASRGRVTAAQALAVINRTPALAPLAKAIARPSDVATLTAGYEAVVGGHQPGSVDPLMASLLTLQSAEGQIEPAIRLVAAHGHTAPSAVAAETAIEADPHVKELAQLVAGWPAVYGAFTLVEQSAAGS